MEYRFLSLYNYSNLPSVLPRMNHHLICKKPLNHAEQLKVKVPRGEFALALVTFWCMLDVDIQYTFPVRQFQCHYVAASHSGPSK